MTPSAFITHLIIQREPPSAEHPDGSYEKNDALVILYIDPQTGAKKRAIYSPSELYALRSKLSNPRDQSEVSIWYTVKAGAIDFSMLEEAGEERGIPVNLYTTQIFLFDDMDEGGYAYGAGDGDPIAEPVASGDDIKSLSLILDKAMGNDVDNSEVQAAVQDVVQLMRSI